MTLDRHRSLLLIVALLGVVAASYWQMATAKERLATSTDALTEAIDLRARITHLRGQPDRAVSDSHSERMLAETVERCARQAGIPQSHIARIEPQAPRRVSDTSYMEHDTAVRLEGITLLELAKLSVALKARSASVGNLYLTTLRIDQPYRLQQKSQANETWNIDLILTYYVLTPTNSPPKT